MPANVICVYFLTLCFLLKVNALFANETSETCSTLETCLAIIAKPEKNCDKGINEETQAAAKQLQSHGRDSVPALLKLLESPYESVRNKAGYTIEHIEEVEESDLPFLIKAMQTGNGWVAGGIGQIGTDDAYRALVDGLHRKPQTYTQTTGALEQAGEKAILFLLNELTCKPNCPSDELTTALAFVFGEMDAEAEAAIEPLLEIAQNETLKLELRLTALEILREMEACSNKNGNIVLHQLVSTRNSEIVEAAWETLAKIGDPSAVSRVMAKLNTSDNENGKKILHNFSNQKYSVINSSQKL